MSDNDRGIDSGTQRVNRTLYGLGSQGYPARSHADEARERIGAAQRKAHRAAFSKKPPLSAKSLVARLPNPIISHLSVDDVCRESLLLVDLLGMNNVDIV